MRKPVEIPRRLILSLVGAGVVLVPAFWPRRVPGAEPIPQPSESTPEAFIDRAYAMRKLAVDTGDQPYGAIVVRDGRIIGQAASHVVVHGDPTAHAEMEAIRDAAKRTGSRHLSGAILYSSSHPCAMCEAAAYWAGIDRMVHGRGASDAGAPSLCG